MVVVRLPDGVVQTCKVQFTPDDAREFAKRVDPTLDHAALKKMSRELNRAFDSALRSAFKHHEMPPAGELRKELKDISKRLKTLAKQLGLSSDYRKYIEETNGNPKAIMGFMLEVTKQFDWLAKGTVRTDIQQKASNPSDQKWERQFWELVAFADEIVDRRELKAIEVEWERYVDGRSKENRPTSSEKYRQLIVGEEKIATAMEWIPVVLGFMLALCDRSEDATRRFSTRSKRLEAAERAFRDTLYSGLIKAHELAFGYPPKRRGSSRKRDSHTQPYGKGVFWAQEVLTLAPQRLKFGERKKRAPWTGEWEARAEGLLNNLAQDQHSTIQKRLGDPTQARRRDHYKARAASRRSERTTKPAHK